MAEKKIVQKMGGALAAGVVGLLMFAAPVAAQTYSDGGGNNTNQGTDQNPGGDNGTGNAGGGGTEDGGNGAAGGGTDDDGVVTQVADDLAFTGSDARSLALIGAGVAGAGALLVISTRRKETQLV